VAIVAMEEGATNSTHNSSSIRCYYNCGRKVTATVIMVMTGHDCQDAHKEQDVLRQI